MTHADITDFENRPRHRLRAPFRSEAAIAAGAATAAAAAAFAGATGLDSGDVYTIKIPDNGTEAPKTRGTSANR